MHLLSNGTSMDRLWQEIITTRSDTLNLSIGTIQIDKIGLKNGGVFDWRNTGFTGNNADGSDWDVLKFDTLDFSESDSFDINIYSLASNGYWGQSPLMPLTRTVLSLDLLDSFSCNILETSSGWNNPGSQRAVNGFNINSDNWAVANDFTMGIGAFGMRWWLLPSILRSPRAFYLFHGNGSSYATWVQFYS